MKPRKFTVSIEEKNKSNDVNRKTSSFVFSAKIIFWRESMSHENRSKICFSLLLNSWIRIIDGEKERKIHIVLLLFLFDSNNDDDDEVRRFRVSIKLFSSSSRSAFLFFSSLMNIERYLFCFSFGLFNNVITSIFSFWLCIRWRERLSSDWFRTVRLICLLLLSSSPSFFPSSSSSILFTSWKTFLNCWRLVRVPTGKEKRKMTSSQLVVVRAEVSRKKIDEKETSSSVA